MSDPEQIISENLGSKFLVKKLTECSIKKSNHSQHNEETEVVACPSKTTVNSTKKGEIKSHECPDTPEIHKWLRKLTIRQLTYLEPIKELRVKHRFLTPNQLHELATNCWYSMLEEQKTLYRQPDLGTQWNYNHKIQQYNFNLHVKEGNWLINNFVEYMADYYFYNPHLGTSEAFKQAGTEWQTFYTQNRAPPLKYEPKSDLQITSTMTTTATTTTTSTTNTSTTSNTNEITNSLESLKTASKILQNYSFFIWGRSFARFYKRFRQYHNDLNLPETVRQAVYFWNIMPLKWKERYLNNS